MDGSQGWRLAVGDVGLADVGCGMGELSPGWFGCADADAGAEAHGGHHCHPPGRNAIVAGGRHGGLLMSSLQCTIIEK